ncbi:MAG: amidohydrolase family protein [Treponema sp.]|nr:amidohydrolase family protein [Treponema sp.]
MAKIIDTTFDHHVHIGQWKDEYFSAEQVFLHLQQNGKSGCCFMSTTSCAPLHFDDRKEINNLYVKVRNEILFAIKTAKKIKFKANPYYWVVPLFHITGISLEQVFNELPDYCGLKIHPLSHNWNPKEKERAELLTTVFEFAQARNLPIILHTGVSLEDSPCLYEKWYKKFPSVRVTLAHSRNLSEVKYLFDNYPQLNGDTAFIPQDNFDFFRTHGYKDRLVYGSDYPICKE